MATLTLKNVPEELIARLKREAAANRRSMNQEAIAQLSGGGSLGVAALNEIWARREEMRRRGVYLTAREIDRAIDEGRERRSPAGWGDGSADVAAADERR